MGSRRSQVGSLGRKGRSKGRPFFFITRFWNLRELLKSPDLSPHSRYPSSFIWFIALIAISCKTEAPRIDRLDLVTRHNVVLNHVDTLGSLTVGNGEFAFTVDVSGLQTFPRVYENGIPLGTQAQWGWHASPNENGYSLSDVARTFESCDGSSAPYPIQHMEGRPGDATNYLRANPHRLQLAEVGLVLLKESGQEVMIDELTDIQQKLDLWTGKIESQYNVEGEHVKVTLYALQDDDGIAARIESSLIAKQRIKLRIKFPYGAECHVCPGFDWSQPKKHTSTLEPINKYSAVVERKLDSTHYYTNVSWSSGIFEASRPHEFLLSPDPTDNFVDVGVVFTRDHRPYDVDFEEVSTFNQKHWENFWMAGAAVDFSACTDPRAQELERRVVLSQYLTKVQCSGSLPPQETGLTMNSWYGKFHLEMHWWHGAHFALWNRSSLLARSLEWYSLAIEPARKTAAWQGYQGARWQKMTEPQGRESPSDVGAFIIWQQPHPIYLAELMYRDIPDPTILERYREVVFATADFMASFAKEKDGVYHLCHPLIPAQEIFNASQTDDPTFELQYWRWALKTAQEWRKRLELEPDPKWQDVIDHLAAPAIGDGLYLPNATTPNAYTDSNYRRDHPSVLAALGCLPRDTYVDPYVMKLTLDNISKNWQWDTTWGWDYPMMAMTAARVNDPELAIELLMKDTPKNTYLVNGHNYQDERLRLYLPGNGGLLTAVAMMAAGWDGVDGNNPGFPKDGTWNVRWEGLHRMP